MIDTHCHIFNCYYDNIDDIIISAKESGVKMIIVNGYNMNSNREVLELVSKYDIVYGAIGIQPEELDDYTDDSISFIENHINDDKIIALGEIGLDYHYECNREKQKELFKRQLDIASMYNKPVIVHSRDCIKETYDILKEYNIKGIMHCYSGSVEMAHEFNKLGFLLGIGGIVTFKNAKKLVDVIKNVSLEYIVLETDSPYLTPEPYRGNQNKPSYISFILKKISEIKGLNERDVNNVINLNILRLFDKNIKL